MDKDLLAELAQPDAEYRSVPFNPSSDKSSLDLSDIAKALSLQLPKGLPRKAEKKKKKEKKEKGEKEKETGEEEKKGKKEKGEKEKKLKGEKEKETKKAKGIFTFEVGNTAEVVEGAGEENKWRWCCYVRGKTPEDEAAIKSVTFKLHPTFDPPQKEATQSPFEIRRVGWGTFEVGICVVLKKDKKAGHELKHQLSFNDPSTTTVVLSL